MENEKENRHFSYNRDSACTDAYRMWKAECGDGNMTKKNLAIGGIELDDSAKVVTLDGDAVSLTPTEYDILKLFM